MDFNADSWKLRWSEVDDYLNLLTVGFVNFNFIEVAGLNGVESQEERAYEEKLFVE